MNIDYLIKPNEKKTFEYLKARVFEAAEQYYDINRNSKPYNRLITEFKSLKDENAITSLMLVYLTCRYLENAQINYIIDGPLGESFVSYLLGISLINPLERHYICPVCRGAQVHGRKKKQPFDLYEDEYKICPKCKNGMAPAGMNLSFKRLIKPFTILISENVNFEFVDYEKFIVDSWDGVFKEEIVVGIVKEQGLIINEDRNVCYVRKKSSDIQTTIFEEYDNIRNIWLSKRDNIKGLLDEVCEKKIELNRKTYYSIMDLEKEMYEKKINENLVAKMICAIMVGEELSVEMSDELKKKNIVIPSEIGELRSFSYLYNTIWGRLLR